MEEHTVVCPPDTQLEAEDRDGLLTTVGDSSAASILDIVQTRDGYLWLATTHGVARFDEVRFAVFDAWSTPHLVYQHHRRTARRS
jgi:ligand-binding sensor domain-containing protein